MFQQGSRSNEAAHKTGRVELPNYGHEFISVEYPVVAINVYGSQIAVEKPTYYTSVGSISEFLRYSFVIISKKIEAASKLLRSEIEPSICLLSVC